MNCSDKNKTYRIVKLSKQIWVCLIKIILIIVNVFHQIEISCFVWHFD